ncbi:MAG TPA: DUF3226 domain-containing protein [Candidatus Acidoferrum sp.]|jgi:hypothetical protein|nr:DUF3226 domain-containing protein [Candidatus Acidoferrum sp.]
MKFLFCEGKNDKAVIQSLLKHLGMDARVEWTGGKDNLSNFLEEVSKRPEFAQQQVTAFGIFRDANGDAAAAFTSVSDALQQNKFSPPNADRTFSNGSPRVGICIVGVDGRGMIEDVCLKSVSDQPEFACVEEYFACIAIRSSRSDFSAKAKVRVWMASHVDHEYYVGKAAEEGYWPWDHSAFDIVKSFLKAL